MPHAALSMQSNTSGDVKALATRLQAELAGDTRFDALARTMYATDASMYEITPIGVVWPRSVHDVVTTVRACREYGIPLVARGAGTGLTGGAVGAGLQLDLSRYMNRIGSLDRQARTIEVEPGVVLDELNAHLEPHGLMFAPDVATSSRATLGGMIANNSCGAHSVVFGRTVDHVAALTVVLADGDVVTFGDHHPPLANGSQKESDQTGPHRLEKELEHIRDDCYEEIVNRFPKVLRSNGGYGLDRLGPPGTPAKAIKILCGSEGTLGIVVGAKLKLVPLPKFRGLCVLNFGSLSDALAVTPAILEHEPAAVELVDRMILQAAQRSPINTQTYPFLSGDPEALLIVELFGEDQKSLTARLDALVADGGVISSSQGVNLITDPSLQEKVWNLRRAGLGLLMSKPGDDQSYAFVEDSAVDPSRLREYIDRFRKILAGENVDAGFYAHASVGCIHVRPILNLKRAQDVERMRRIAEAASDLALEFGGAMTGEHGDGLVRSCWLEKMYGPRIIQAFREIKQLFDPQNLLNPNKIVDPLSMTDHLRYGPTWKSKPVKTHLDFSAHGGMAGLASMCSGVGVCRQRLVGTMCPSYMATNDEVHTTRARANALRVALSNRGLLEGLSDPALDEVMDLCIGCKACKNECPTGVDMARLKAEYLSHKNLRQGVPLRARMVADLPQRLRTMGRFPRITNLISRSRLMRAWMQARYGLDARLALPKLATQSFRAWFQHHRKTRPPQPAPRGTIMYLVDTWTNYFTPQTGIATVSLLEAAGYEVLCPRTMCCGRPAISQGLLGEAKRLAEFNVRRLIPFAAKGGLIVGSEPSCTLTYVDEYPQLVRSPSARTVADRVVTIETLLARLLRDHPGALTFREPTTDLKYHAHCHQRAMIGSQDAVELLRCVWGNRVDEINSGCCGMAGAFGHEVEHYDIAQAIGEQRLFPAVRERGQAAIAVSGFSCRQQIEHHTGVNARHVVEHLATALVKPDP